MPKARSTAPSGEVFEFYVPEGTSVEQAQQMAPRMDILRKMGVDITQPAPTLSREPERTLAGHAGEVGRGVVRGALGLLESGATGASFLLPEEEEQAAREGIASLGDTLASPFQAKPGYEDAISGNFAEAFGSTTPLLALGAAGLPGILAGAGLGTAAGSGIAAQRADAAGATEEEISEAAGKGMLPGALEMLPPVRMARQFKVLRNALGDDVTSGMLNRIRRVAREGGAEGAQEVVSEIGQNLIARDVYDPEQDVFTGTGESFGYGAGVGGFLQGLLELGIRSRPVPRSDAGSEQGGFDDGDGPGTASAGEAAQMGFDFGDVEQSGEQMELPLDTPAQPRAVEPAQPEPEEGAPPQGQFELDLEPGQTQLELPLSAEGADGNTVNVPLDVPPGLPAPEISFPAVFGDGTVVRDRTQFNDYVEQRRERVREAQQFPPAVVAKRQREEARRASEGLPPQRELSLEITDEQPARLTKQRLTGLGVSPRAKVVSAVSGLDTTNPEQRAEAIGELTNYVNNATVRNNNPKARRNVQSLIERLNRQGEPEAPVQETQESDGEQLAMIGPRGGITKDGQRGAGRRQRRKPVVSAVSEPETAPEPEAPGEVAAEEAAPDNVTPLRPEPTQEQRVDQALTELGGADERTATDELLDDMEISMGVNLAPDERTTLKRRLDKIADLDKKLLAAERYMEQKDKAEAEPVVEPEPEPVSAQADNSGTFTMGDVEAAGIPGLSQDWLDTNVVGRTREELQQLVDETPGFRSYGKYAALADHLLESGPRGDGSTQGELTTQEDLDSLADEMLDGDDTTFNQENRPTGLGGASPAISMQRRAAVDLEQKIRAGASPVELMQSIAKDRRLPAGTRRVARRLSQLGRWMDIEVVMDPNLPFRVDGQFQLRDWRSTIRISPTSNKMVETYIHEHMHALTALSITRAERIGDNAVGQRFRELFNEYSRIKGASNSYGFTNAHEFVAEAMANQRFQAELRDLKAGQRSMWQRFVDSVRDLLGIRKEDTQLLDELLDLTRQAHAAVPSDMRALVNDAKARAGANAANAASSYQTVKSSKSALEDMGTYFNAAAVPARSAKRSDWVFEQFTKGGRKAKQILAWGVQLPSLVDATKRFASASPQFVKGAQDFLKATVDSEGDRARFRDSYSVTMKRVGDWMRNSSVEKVQAFNDLYFNGSEAQVDLRYKEDRYKNDPEKLAAYRALKDGPWKKVGESGRALYRAMRTMHDTKFQQFIDQIYGEVEDATGNSTVATTLKNALNRQLVERGGGMEGYAHFGREGDHLLEYFIKDPRTGEYILGFEMFETKRERDRAFKEMEAHPDVKPKSVRAPAKLSNSAYTEAVPDRFMKEVIEGLNTIEDVDQRNALMESIMSTAVQMSPATSAARMLAKRKNTPGYKRDAGWAFQRSMMNIGTKLINSRVKPKLNKALRQMQEGMETVPGGKTENMTVVYEEMAKRAKFIANPVIGNVSNAVTSGAYAMTLSFNPSSAIVDMSALPLITAPYLKARFPKQSTSAALARATKRFFGAGSQNVKIESMLTEGLEGEALQKALDAAGIKGRDFSETRGHNSIRNLDLSLPENAHLAELVAEMDRSGHIERFSTIEEASEIGEANVLSRAGAYMGAMMHSSERSKREIGVLAHYELALEDARRKNRQVTPELRAELAREAIETSMILNGGSSASTAPGFSQHDIGRVAFMYKRYSAINYYVQARSMYYALQKADPDSRAAARRFMAMMMFNSALLAGARGMPMMGVVAMTFNLFRDDQDDDFETAMRKNIGNLATEGVINGLLGANVGPRIELTNMMISQDTLPEDATLADKIMLHLGGPAYGSVNRWWRGKKLVEQGHIERGIETALPVAVANVLKSFRMASEGARTLRGDPIVEDITAGGVAAQFLGFSPADVSRAYEFTGAQYRRDRAAMEKRSRLLQRMYLAQHNGDTREYAESLRDLLEIFRENPRLAMRGRDIQASMEQRRRNSLNAIRGGIPSETNRQKWLEEFEEWGLE